MNSKVKRKVTWKDLERLFFFGYGYNRMSGQRRQIFPNYPSRIENLPCVMIIYFRAMIRENAILLQNKTRNETSTQDEMIDGILMTQSPLNNSHCQTSGPCCVFQIKKTQGIKRKKQKREESPGSSPPCRNLSTSTELATYRQIPYCTFSSSWDRQPGHGQAACICSKHVHHLLPQDNREKHVRPRHLIEWIVKQTEYTHDKYK